MTGFIVKLREAGIPVSVKYVLEFYRGLRLGLATDLDRLFLFSRLVFVKRVEYNDTFEQVFSAFFLGAASRGNVPDWEDLIAGKPFRDWLSDELKSGRLTPEALREFDTEELLARFWQTLLDQDGAHHGGNRWIGTGGRSPYGHGGKVGGGIRVFGQGLHGTAQMVIGSRRYLNYSEQSSLAAENLGQALTSLRSLQPTGPATELDVDSTISQTARNGGEIELIFRQELRNRLKLIVLLDNGGYSMTRHLSLVKTVFNKMTGVFRDLSYYYFHNCIYGTVYLDARRSQPLTWEKLTSEDRTARLVVIGDANMAPFELMASYGSLDPQSAERRPGFEWLRELRSCYPVSVWLNPLPRYRWDHESSTIARVGSVFHMEDLTLAGIKSAVSYLNAQGQNHDR